ncbi:MAG: ATPase, T2SS/T4P/T4SS family [Planctomycetota bacterium]
MGAELHVLDRGQKVQKLALQGECIVGKSPDATVVLDRLNISRRHCRLFESDGFWSVEDLDSRNGTWVNGVRLEQSLRLQDGMKITLGDFELLFRSAPPVVSNVPKVRPVDSPVAVPKRSVAVPVDLKRQVHTKLLEDKSLKALAGESDEILRQKTRDVVETLVKDLRLPSTVTREAFVKVILDEALGLGPLEDLLEDPTITEIMVNNWDTVYVERAGRIELTDRQFTDNTQLLGIIRRILAPIGRRIDESSPLVDARLKDGSRVNAIIPPLSLKGPTVTVRKFAKKPFTVQDLIRLGSLTPALASLMELAVKHRQNILISGGTGSGKTTLLNVVSSFIPENERIVTIEDAAELQLQQEHVVRLESRPPNIEGEGAIPIRRLVINSLRMRPDRIVIGECRGGEALDMLQAMNTGHDGSLTTLHANNPRDALTRLETLVLMAGMELPAKSIRQQIASAINLVLQVQRLSDGSRRVTHLSEISGMEGDIVTMADIFVFKNEGFTPEGKVRGSLKATGSIPRFVHELREARIDVDLSIFKAQP